MNVSLPRALRKFVESKVKNGLYQSTSEVFRDGLRLLMEQDRLREIRAEDLKNKVAAGLADLEAGRVVDGEVFFDRLERELDGQEQRERKPRRQRRT